MTFRRMTFGWALLVGWAGLVVTPPMLLAGTQSGVDANTVRDVIAPMADPVPGGITAPAVIPLPGARPQDARGKEREPRGNPLWAIPLRLLSATRERPIFLPSRRPPAPAVAGPPPVRSAAPPPPTEPDRPRLALVGAIAGETEGIAVFVDEATRDIVRLRTGENHAGWILRSVKGREATLQKEQETVVLAMPTPASEPAKAASPEL